ncbi:hypothetical protein GOP47_0008119 [Adiantum capillus-veneris]|uniref:Uncharacterized protein n=1 Tax=Adiantum capillus-veneris TaxID=13818 RepID=A0A9D4UXY0_ADICA|nr:hypothetical protein GOP47_0008119 [Adiantum capillus-veneris]
MFLSTIPISRSCRFSTILISLNLTGGRAYGVRKIHSHILVVTLGVSMGVLVEVSPSVRLGVESIVRQGVSCSVKARLVDCQHVKSRVDGNCVGGVGGTNGFLTVVRKCGIIGGTTTTKYTSSIIGGLGLRCLMRVPTGDG